MSRRDRRGLACVVLGGVAAAPAAQNADAAAAADFVARCGRSGSPSACGRSKTRTARAWSYFPGRARKGIALKDECAGAAGGLRDAARGALLAAATRRCGRVSGVLDRRSLRRDPDLYYLTIFGEPSDRAPVVLAFRGPSPQPELFLGDRQPRLGDARRSSAPIPPAFPQGPHAGLRVLAAEEDLARRLLGSLDARQRRSAVVSATRPRTFCSVPAARAFRSPRAFRRRR